MYCSSVITSQLPIAHWHDFIGEPNFTDAILDRLLENAHKIEFKGGESMRNRSLLHIPVITQDYKQTAIVANIHLTRSHGGIAYERFTSKGILAMLPLLASPGQIYAERCGADQEKIIGFVDGLIKLFGKQNGLLSRLRGLALQFLDASPTGKYYLARLPLGVAGRVSKLASGIPL